MRYLPQNKNTSTKRTILSQIYQKKGAGMAIIAFTLKYAYLSLCGAGIVLFLVFFLGCSFQSYESKGFVLLYGISKYIDSLPEGQNVNLTYCDDDIRALEKRFSKKSGYEIFSRIDSEATLEQLKADIETISNTADQNDAFVFYFSGHGLSVSYSSGTEKKGDIKEEFLFPYGSVSNTGPPYYFTDLDYEKALHDDEFDKLLNNLPMKKKAVIIDACNSGGFIGNGSAVEEMPDGVYGYNFPDEYKKENTNGNILPPLFKDSYSTLKDGIKLYLTAPSLTDYDISASNAIVLSAAGQRDSSHDSPAEFSFNHGVFTYYFLEATEYGDYNKDGYISIMEIYRYTSNKLQNEWNAYYLEKYKNNDAFTKSDLEIMTFHPMISGSPIDFILF